MTAMISLLEKLFTRVFESAESRERAAREAYLAEATDIYELEFRMKQLDTAQGRNWLQ
jgi:hypothetical protein